VSTSPASWKRRPQAQLLTRREGDGVTAFVVDCKYSTTTLLQIPGRLFLPDGALVLAVAYTHEEECQRCDLGPVFAKADPELRRTVDSAWARMAVAERRN
jgi:hypothetical protein